MSMMRMGAKSVHQSAYWTLRPQVNAGDRIWTSLGRLHPAGTYHLQLPGSSRCPPLIKCIEPLRPRLLSCLIAGGINQAGMSSRWITPLGHSLFHCMTRFTLFLSTSNSCRAAVASSGLGLSPSNHECIRFHAKRCLPSLAAVPVACANQGPCPAPSRPSRRSSRMRLMAGIRFSTEGGKGSVSLDQGACQETIRRLPFLLVNHNAAIPLISSGSSSSIPSPAL